MQVTHNKTPAYSGVVFVSCILMNSYLPKETLCH